MCTLGNSIRLYWFVSSILFLTYFKNVKAKALLQEGEIMIAKIFDPFKHLEIFPDISVERKRLRFTFENGKSNLARTEPMTFDNW